MGCYKLTYDYQPTLFLQEQRENFYTLKWAVGTNTGSKLLGEDAKNLTQGGTISTVRFDSFQSNWGDNTYGFGVSAFFHYEPSDDELKKYSSFDAIVITQLEPCDGIQCTVKSSWGGGLNYDKGDLYYGIVPGDHERDNMVGAGNYHLVPLESNMSNWYYTVNITFVGMLGNSYNYTPLGSVSYGFGYQNGVMKVDGPK